MYIFIYIYFPLSVFTVSYQPYPQGRGAGTGSVILAGCYFSTTHPPADIFLRKLEFKVVSLFGETDYGIKIYDQIPGF